MKQIIIVLSFIIVWTGVSLLTVFSEEWSGPVFETSSDSGSRVSNESFFKGVNYYVQKNHIPQLKLNATEVTVNSTTGNTLFFDPVGEAYTKGGEPILYKGSRGIYNQGMGSLFINEKVQVNINESQLNSDRLIYNLGKDRVETIGNVKTKSVSTKNGDKIFVESERAISWPKKRESRYLGQVSGKIIRKRAYEAPVFFESNRMYLKLNEMLVTLNEKVTLKKQPFKATSHRGEIYLENYNKKLKYFVLNDDVKLEEKVVLSGTSYLRKAYAEKLEGVMAEDKIILTGFPKVYQQSDVIKGNRIILRENNEVVEVDDANTNIILR
ncbi:MAG: LPS export ABC transporter periplasmic protein LptC [Bacteriovoracaceae bacterium]|nr:LPS export ABC transporter periplasmic protein LptC [Bacteriovoracaceae bacterium]